MIEVQLKGYISELNFGYNAKMEEYATLMSDITKLYEMLGRPTLIVKHM